MDRHRAGGRARHSNSTIGFVLGVAILTAGILIAWLIA